MAKYGIWIKGTGQKSIDYAELAIAETLLQHPDEVEVSRSIEPIDGRIRVELITEGVR